MATTASTFSGSSSYAADLQSAITRAVSFATLPVTLLQNKQNEISSQQTALASLKSKFDALNTALSTMDKASTTGSLVASTTDSTVLTATAGSGAKAGRYTVNVVSMGSQTNSLSVSSQPTVTDPAATTIGSGSGYSLTVNGQSFSVTGTTTNLNGLADAINASGAGVSATVINVGGPNSPDYRLSILGSKYSPATIALSDSANTSLLDTLSTGSYVTYQVNGQPSTPINSETRTLNFATGLSVTAYKTGSADVNVVSSSASLGVALNALATTYNSAYDELSKARGQNNGPLSGESIVSTLTQTLRSVINSGTPTGSILSVADLGLSYDKDGHLSFDGSVLSSAMSKAPADVASFVGSSTSGFLSAAMGLVNGATNSSTGVISQSTSSNATQLTALSTKISSLQERITLMQDSLVKKMTKADATISSLQSQTNYYTNLFAQMRANQLSASS